MALLENERQALHSRLLDAVRACQTHLGGKSEMVTETSSWVSCLCTQIEAVLQHQLKQPSKGLSVGAFKQVAVRPASEETTFWGFIKSQLTKHEVERFNSLSNISTDLGKGRAWIRCSLNEHSLDRYFHILLGDLTALSNFYEREAFMLDEEKSSTLPQMAAGLSSIYFNIKFNDGALNGTLKPSQPHSSGFIPTLLSATTSVITKEDKSRSDSILEAHCAEKPKKRAGKKKRANIISFGDDVSSSDGPMTPAVKGGPGFVVAKQTLIKSNASCTSESSSGVFSSDGNAAQGNEPKSKVAENLRDLDKALHATAPTNSNAGDSLNNRLTTGKATVDDSNWSSLAQLSMQSTESTGVSESLQSSRVAPATQTSPELDQSEIAQRDNGEADDFVDVHRHLLSVKQRSLLGSHDLVMDDWSVRSNSLSGGLLTPDGNLPEVHPMQNECGDSQSSESIHDTTLQSNSTSTASLVLSLAQKSSTDLKKRVAGVTMPDNMDKDTMTESELRQALMALVHRNDELIEANRSTRTLLDSEMEQSASLRGEIEKLQQHQKYQKEEVTTMQQQHIRENEVLRNQLKKYVGAVQALQRGDPNLEMPGDLPRISSDVTSNDNEAEVYEKKLIEVAEMHGELMEFNERLHVRLQSAVSLLRSMKSELVDLRGPMPNDDLVSRIENDNIVDEGEQSPPISRALINIWIPSAFLKEKATSAHHLFQVFVRIGDEEWNVYRRYSQFHGLHLQLRKKYSILDTFGFPPKKVVGNKDKKFVDDRRKGLQLYLRMVMNNIVQNHEKIVAKPNKDTLVALLPFFNENFENKKKSKSRRRGE